MKFGTQKPKEAPDDKSPKPKEAPEDKSPLTSLGAAGRAPGDLARHLQYEVNWSPEGLEGLAELTGLPRLAEFRVQFVLSWVPFRWLGTLFGRPLGVLRHHFSEPGLPRDAQGDTWGSNHGF